MNHILLPIVLLFIAIPADCQHYCSSQIFAHNDYETATPFHTAYGLKVGYIEADVFLINEQLLVAHHENETEMGRTLEALYLDPLREKVRQNNGTAYADKDQSLTLMIDLKTEGVATLMAIVEAFEKYPELISCPALHIMISGNVPDPELWKGFPSYISFDGRPDRFYTPSQWKRIRMISTNFRQHVQWDGKGKLPQETIKNIHDLMSEAHKNKKPFRFWATPDFENAWDELMRAGVDVIGTDNVVGLAEYLKRKK